MRTSESARSLSKSRAGRADAGSQPAIDAPIHNKETEANVESTVRNPPIRAIEPKPATEAPTAAPNAI